MTTAVRLREGTAADIAALYRLDLLCFEEAFRFDRNTMANLVLAADTLTLVAEIEGVLAGFLIAERRKPDGSLYLATLDVDPAFRRRQIASKLMASLERRAPGGGASVLRLHVATRNYAAIAFYKAGGYAEQAYVADYYGPDQHAYVFAKNLAERHGRQKTPGAINWV